MLNCWMWKPMLHHQLWINLPFPNTSNGSSSEVIQRRSSTFWDSLKALLHWLLSPNLGMVCQKNCNVKVLSKLRCRRKKLHPNPPEWGRLKSVPDKVYDGSYHTRKNFVIRCTSREYHARTSWWHNKMIIFFGWAGLQMTESFSPAGWIKCGLFQ